MNSEWHRVLRPVVRCMACSRMKPSLYSGMLRDQATRRGSVAHAVNTSAGTTIQRDTCPLAGGTHQLARKVTMVSWFISPWEAARFSMEAQRLIALQFFGLAFPKARPKEQGPEERASGEEKASVPRQALSMGSSGHAVMPSKGMGLIEKERLPPVATRKRLKRLLALATEKVERVKGNDESCCSRT